MKWHVLTEGGLLLLALLLALVALGFTVPLFRALLALAAALILAGALWRTLDLWRSPAAAPDETKSAERSAAEVSRPRAESQRQRGVDF